MSTRVERFTSLRIHGLFDKEAQELSKNEVEDVPYFNNYLVARQNILKQWKHWKVENKIPEGKGRNKYRDMVYVWYESHGWVKSDNKIDVWKAWRHYESEWKVNNPDYPKPSYKRHKDIMETEKKLRKSLGF